VATICAHQGRQGFKVEGGGGGKRLGVTVPPFYSDSAAVGTHIGHGDRPFHGV
jgi:hypothetical protein